MPRRGRRDSDSDDHSPQPYYIEISPERRSDRSKSRDKTLDFGLKVLDFFKPRRRRSRRIVRVVEEPVRPRRRQYTQRSESIDPSPSPRGRRSMSPRPLGDDFVPLPPKLPNEARSPDRGPGGNQEQYAGYDVEVIVPRSPRDPAIRRRQPFEEPQPEIFEVREPQRTDADWEKAKRKEAERRLRREREAHAATARASERTLHNTLNRVADGVRQLNVQHQRTQAELEQERRNRLITERERDILMRQRQQEDQERQRQLGAYVPNILAPPARPVDLFQEPVPRGPGHDAIRQAQEDARRQEVRRRDDDLLYQNHRQRHPDTGGRRGSIITYEDDDARRGYRRR